MENYVKYIDAGHVEAAPAVIIEEKYYIANPKEDDYRARGWKPLVEIERGEAKEPGYWIEHYEDTEEAVIKTWEHVAEEEPSPEEQAMEEEEEDADEAAEAGEEAEDPTGGDDGSGGCGELSGGCGDEEEALKGGE